jgi:hypothetical protein
MTINFQHVRLSLSGSTSHSTLFFSYNKSEKKVLSVMAYRDNQARLLDWFFWRAKNTTEWLTLKPTRQCYARSPVVVSTNFTPLGDVLRNWMGMVWSRAPAKWNQDPHPPGKSSSALLRSVATCKLHTHAHRPSAGGPLLRPPIRDKFKIMYSFIVLSCVCVAVAYWVELASRSRWEN